MNSLLFNFILLGALVSTFFTIYLSIKIGFKRSDITIYNLKNLSLNPSVFLVYSILIWLLFFLRFFIMEDPVTVSMALS